MNSLDHHLSLTLVADIAAQVPRFRNTEEQLDIAAKKTTGARLWHPV
jgi:hypothetical protein